jgi:hypothetical protein
VSSVNGVVANEIDFWDLSGSISELARGTTLGSTGWTDNTDYTFEFNFTSPKPRGAYRWSLPDPS